MLRFYNLHCRKTAILPSLSVVCIHFSDKSYKHFALCIWCYSAMDQLNATRKYLKLDIHGQVDHPAIYFIYEIM